ncbi:anthranilate phosphoribosyltransferase [Marinivivus vitaminiproducens]|uniref:anthranilate phosphoribosyltransferase n=1 Tax=Marinivivus vitaminiproducens TaxID=3035935 RepID=UPI0027A0292B|nr:hypothetical protein P4R82_11605 [Geminicoccaceae bacterium SCSIO 64248]
MDIVDALINTRREPLDVSRWESLWIRLYDGRVSSGEAIAVMTSLSTALPDPDTLLAFVTSLRRRRVGYGTSAPVAAANIVGTGGGPSTFNISTATAFVAAAMGVPVLKSGSRAYSSQCGSIDLLSELGVPLTRTPEETLETLHRSGIACAGYYVYPPELTLLAKAILPMPMRTLGRFLNLLGPFLADLPATAQLTGVSDRSSLAALRHIAAADDRRIWLVTNERGADELLSIARSDIFPNDGSMTLQVDPAQLGLAPGRLSDLAPCADKADRIRHFEALLTGDASPVALDTICLNVAALACLHETTPDWPCAIAEARRTIGRGHAAALLRTLRREHSDRVTASRIMAHV